MSTILDNILAVKAEEVAAGKKDHPVDQLADRCEKASPCRNFFQAVTAQTHRRINLIAEIKRKSPSAGVIRSDFDPVRIAQHYQQADAAALSVLTDETFFGGNLDYLQQVKDAVALPVLRKDFIIDPWQVYQSRLAGADAILLIAEALPTGQLIDLLILATELKMTTLIEMHDVELLLKLRSMPGFPQQDNCLLGINNRDLRTFQVDINTTIRLAGMLEDTSTLVAESGIRNREDITKLRRAGVRAVLVGETLMRSDDIVTKVSELFDD